MKEGARNVTGAPRIGKRRKWHPVSLRYSLWPIVDRALDSILIRRASILEEIWAMFDTPKSAQHFMTYDVTTIKGFPILPEVGLSFSAQGRIFIL